MTLNRSCLVALGAGILFVVTLGAQPAPSCDQWNTEDSFRAAAVADVTACLAAGADAVARDEDDITPLHWATWTNDEPGVVGALLAAGADLQARNGNGDTQLQPPATKRAHPLPRRVRQRGQG